MGGLSVSPQLPIFFENSLDFRFATFFYRKVWSVSSKFVSAGLTEAIMIVLLLPPSESAVREHREQAMLHSCNCYRCTGAEEKRKELTLPTRLVSLHFPI